MAVLAAADPDHRYELQDGTLLVIPPPDRGHAAILMDLGSWLRTVGHARRTDSEGRQPERHRPQPGCRCQPATVLLDDLLARDDAKELLGG
ncbi:MAG: hypothetical protein ACRDT2_17525 [Natronosporangium sp.]